MKKYSTEEQRQYVDGGVPVFIDGQEAEEKDWDKLFQVQEDGAFYMCDYIGTEEGILKEIRFDRVYNR